jgi:hypothetical protein
MSPAAELLASEKNSPRPGRPERHPFSNELVKFLMQDVRVLTSDGGIYSGNCRGIYWAERSVALMTDEDKILIANVIEIRRRRTYQGAAL